MCHQVSSWGAPTLADTIEFQNFLVQLNNERSGSKTMCGFSIILILKGIMTFYKVKESMHFAEKNINFNKNEAEFKMENPRHSFRETNLVLQLI